MKRLHLLVLRSFIGPLILIFFIVLFVLLMQFLWRYIDDLVGKGLEFSVIAELLMYTSSSLVPMALPLAILMASLMTFGNMGEFYELTAIKSSGISLQRIMMPLAILVVGISIGAFFFANEVLPYTNLKMRSLLYDVSNQRPEIQILPGSFYNGIDGYSIRVNEKDPITNMLYDIKIYDHTNNRGNTSVTLADSGKMIITDDQRSLIFTLYNGYSYHELEDESNQRRKKTYPHRYDQFGEQEVIIELSGFSLKRTDEDLFRNHYSMLDLDQLNTMKDSINIDIDEKEKLLSRTILSSNFFRKHQQSSSAPKTIETAEDRKSRARDLKTAQGKTLPTKNTRNNDEIELPKRPTVNLDTNQDTAFYHNLYDKLTLREKDMVLSSALSFARSSRTYVVSSANTIDSKIRSLRKFEIEWHRKFTIAFACFVFLLIGAPLGAIIRKGGLGLPLVLSTLFFIFYYIITLMGEKFVRESILPDYQGMWMGSALFFIAGVFLTYKATTDAAILNFDTYANFFKKFQKRRTLIETLHQEQSNPDQKKVRTEHVVSSLVSLQESSKQIEEKVNDLLKITDFSISLVSLTGDSDIILFERLYRNIGRSIKNSELIQISEVRAKFYQFPAFNADYFVRPGWQIVLKYIMLALPPLTLIPIVQHLYVLLSLKGKVKNIRRLTEEFINQVRKHV